MAFDGGVADDDVSDRALPSPADGFAQTLLRFHPVLVRFGSLLRRCSHHARRQHDIVVIDALEIQILTNYGDYTLYRLFPASSVKTNSRFDKFCYL